MSTDNFEEVRSGGKSRRARSAKTASFSVPIEADIAAVTLVAPLTVELVELPHPTAAAPAEQFQKESNMATTAETVTETTTAATSKGAQIFADMNERAKGAAERGAKLFDEVNGFTKGNVEALVESGRIAAKGFEAMGQEAADYARRQMETATANMRQLASVKSPTEFVKLQADFTRAAFDQAVAETSRSTEAMLKLAGEVVQPISNRFALAADRIKSVA